MSCRPRASWSCPSAVLLIALAAGSAQAVVRNVPADFATIQAAINAAAAGDEVVVAPGVYAENIDFLGKAILVRSAAGAASTTITGSGLTGPVVSFVSAETGQARLEGFTVTGGLVINDDGAGVRIVGASPTILNCVITANTVRADDPLLEGLQARGAGMAVLGGSPTLTGVVFSANTATYDTVGGTGDGYGGGLFVEAPATVTITGGGFTGNRTIGNENNGGNGGGGIYATGGPTITITGTTFTGNFSENGNPGAIVHIGGVLTLANATFDANYARLGSTGGVGFYDGDTLTITGCTFRDQNTPETDLDLGSVGALELFTSIGPGPVVTISDSTFTGNISQGGNPGILSFRADLTVTNCTFSDQKSFGGSGGGISVQGGTATIDRCTFTNNEAGGGGIFATRGLFSSEIARLTVTNSTFTSNLADGASGGAINVERGTLYQIGQCTFTGNTANGGSGGAFHAATSSQGVIASSNFTDHSTPGGSGSTMFLTSGTHTLEDVTIAGSLGARAVQVQGATVTGRRVTISGSQFGPLGAGSAGASVPIITLEDSTIADNTGTAAIAAGSFSFVRSTFRGSTGTTALQISNAATATLRESRFLANGLGGVPSGAALTIANAATVTAINCLFAGNNGVNGAVRINNNAGLTAINSTFADNAPDTNHAQILVNNSALGSPARFIGRNSIFAGPYGFNAQNFRINGSNTSIDLESCNVEGGFSGVGITTFDPFFNDPFSGDFSLQVISPVIDIGNNGSLPGGVPGDLAGNQRVAGLAVDLGAFESDAVACAPSITTPPTPLVVCPGDPVSFSVVAAGQAPLTFRWRRDGLTIDPVANTSAATDALALAAADAADAGTYDVIVTSPCGSVRSAAVTLTVRPASDPLCNTPSCVPDFNGDTALNDDDLSEFITAYFEIFAGPGGYAQPCPGADAPFDTLGFRADITGDCSLNDDDLSLFITLYFLGCN